MNCEKEEKKKKTMALRATINWWIQISFGRELIAIPIESLYCVHESWTAQNLLCKPKQMFYPYRCERVKLRLIIELFQM